MKLAFKVAAVVILGSMFFWLSQARGQFFLFGNPNIGKPARDFTLKMVRGQMTNMTRYRERKKAIIFFWAIWCPHCRTALDELNAKRANFEEKGIKLVIVDLGETEKTVLDYLAAKKKENKEIFLDIFLDVDSDLVDPYMIMGVPTFYFLDEEGIVRAVEHDLPGNYEELF